MITNTQRRHDIVGTGGAGPFSYQFMILNDTDLAVYVDGNLKTLTTHYTVSGVGNESGGTITFTTGNYPALSADIILLGAEAETQTHDFQVAATLPAASLEESVDKLTRLVQQLTERVNRAPVLPVGDSGGFSALTLPAPGDGQYLRWSGHQLALGTPTLVPDDVPAGGGNYDHLIVNSGGAVAWGQELYHYAANFKNIARYGNSLSSAVSSIGGSTKVCLLISESISVTGNITVTDNITFFFVGAGGLAISSGVTVTYNAASFLVDDIRRQRFTGSGTFDGANLSAVIPDQWGADYTGTGDSTAALQAAHDSLPAAGGVIDLPAGTYDFSDTLTFTKPITLRGHGEGVTVMNLTGTGSSLQHGIDTTESLTVSHLTMQVETPLASNHSMKAINLDLASAGSAGTRLIVENCTFTGWNIGPYCDGGASYKIDVAEYRNCKATISGSGASTASCFYMHRVNMGTMLNIDADQNSVGDHAIYCFGVKNMKFEGTLRVRNADLAGSQAIKCVGDGSGGSSVAYGTWSVANADIQDCENGVLFSTFGTEVLESIETGRLSFKNVTGSASIQGLVYVSASDTSRIRTVSCRTTTLNNTEYQGFHFSMAAGATINRVTLDGVTAFDWSGASAGSYALIGATSSGTISLMTLRDIYADGNASNGRTIWSANTIGASVKRLKTENLVEANTATPGWPVTFTDLDTTPSLAMGNDFVASNTGATNITQFDNMKRGESYRIRFTNSNTTLVDGVNLICPGSANLNPGDTDIYTIYTPDGTTAYVSAGSNN